MSTLQSQAKLGLELTSISQGFQCASNIMSKPYNSKELGWFGIASSATINVLTITLSIAFCIAVTSIPSKEEEEEEEEKR